MTLTLLKMLSDSRSRFEDRYKDGHAIASIMPRAAFLVAAGVCLSSCVVSDKPLIADGKPFLGPQVTMVLYRDFSAGQGYAAQQVSYRWADGGYQREGVRHAHVVKFVAEVLDGKDFLIERSQVAQGEASSNVFTYWIGRQVSDGAYLVFPVNENDLSPAERDAICAKDEPEGFCIVKTHDQLVASARATAGKPPREPAVAVLVDENARSGKSVALDQVRP